MIVQAPCQQELSFVLLGSRRLLFVLQSCKHARSAVVSLFSNPSNRYTNISNELFYHEQPRLHLDNCLSKRRTFFQANTAIRNEVYANMKLNLVQCTVLLISIGDHYGFFFYLVLTHSAPQKSLVCFRLFGLQAFCLRHHGNKALYLCVCIVCAVRTALSVTFF